MASAFISSTFCISYAPTDANAKTITNPGRTFKIVAVSANNETAGVGGVAVTLTDGANNIIKGPNSAAANAMTWFELDENHCDIISSTENLVVTSAPDCKVTIYCVAISGGQQLTVS